MNSDAILALIHPFRGILAGPSGAGKTYFVKDLLLTPGRISENMDDIYWFYGMWQPLYDSMKDYVTFFKGLPSQTFYDNLQPNRKSAIVLDDVMSTGSSSDIVSDLFTTGSHHKSISVLFLIQNLYFKGKVMRTISLNASYIILFKNSRDHSQIGIISRQMRPGNGKFIIEAFSDATRKPFGYLLFDFKPETPEELRIRAEIFSDYPVVYLPN